MNAERARVDPGHVRTECPDRVLLRVGQNDDAPGVARPRVGGSFESSRRRHDALKKSEGEARDQHLRGRGAQANDDNTY